MTTLMVIGGYTARFTLAAFVKDLEYNLQAPIRLGILTLSRITRILLWTRDRATETI